MALRQQLQDAHRGDSAVKTYAPDYYPKFHCIAGKCRHSCCIGWEIDIDEDTYDLYQSIGGGFGRRLKNNIENGDPPHFRLCADERCPFLTSDGLCDIILTLGEGALCQICDDHPRFRNYFSDRVEMGVGLCCEAAVKLILNHPSPMELICIEDDGEEELPPDEEEIVFVEKRDRLFRILHDETVPAGVRLTQILTESGTSVPDYPIGRWIEIFGSMECLDSARNEMLKKMSEADLPPEYDDAALKLTEYFLYRHLAGALDDGRFAGRAGFAVLSTWIICRMWAGILAETSELTVDDMAECARMYSSEYEYSDDNTEFLLNLLTADNN